MIWLFGEGGQSFETNLRPIERVRRVASACRIALLVRPAASSRLTRFAATRQGRVSGDLLCQDERNFL